MRKLMWLLVFSLPLACKGGFSENTGWNPTPPADGGDAKAQALIDHVWTAMGALPAYKTYGELRFTWNFIDNASTKKSAFLYWNRFEHRVRWEENAAEGNMLIVRVNLGNPGHAMAYTAKRNTGLRGGLEQAAQSQSGTGLGQFQKLPTSETPHLEEAATASFIQARRWLLGPLNLRDKGVHVKYTEEPHEATGPDKKKYLALVTSFDDSADWENKQDVVTWLVDPDTKMPVWMLWKQGGKEGFSAWSQEDFRDIGGGVKMSTSHKQFGTTIEIQFANVQLNQRPDDDLYFESVK